MILTDTHTHLYSSAFDEDRDEVMQRAFDAGVERFYLPAIDSGTTEAMYQLEEKYPENVFLMMGLHPVSVKADYEKELQLVETELSKRKFCAIGEIGIDLHWDKSTLEIQQNAFRRQIRLAKKYRLPIVIHCRDAFSEVFSILEEEKGEDLFGIFHCFTGTKEQALQAISYNMKLGIGGVVTFKNGKIDKFLNEIALENLVLETDSPYLAPTPFRGKRNESGHLLPIAEKISDIYQLPLEEIAKQTNLNAKAVFGLPEEGENNAPVENPIA